MSGRQFFPLGLASKGTFCNRVKETQLLLSNMAYCKHMLVMAPRRYGKTSLSLHAIHQSGVPFSEIDFFMARNEQVVTEYILKGVVNLVGEAVGPLEKWLATIKQNLKHLKPKFILDSAHSVLELVTQSGVDPATNVLEALMLLEKLLEAKNQKATLLLDEFQMVGVIAKGSGIEVAIRHVAQKTKLA